MSGFSDSNGVAGGRDEPTQDEINQYMQSLSATSARMEGAALPAPAPDGEYVASGTKYSGPLAVFKYEGGHKVHPETGNRMMHTAAGEVATVYYAGNSIHFPFHFPFSSEIMLFDFCFILVFSMYLPL